jgi:general secretion pathway protein M
METLPAEARGGYRRIGLRVSMSAPWPVLIDLLRSAGQQQPRMLVDDVQFRAPPMQVREAAAPVSASFTLLAFRAVPAGGGS